MSTDTLQQLVERFNKEITQTLFEREKLIQEINVLRAQLATKCEALNSSAKRIFDLESELTTKKETIRGLEIELQLHKEALDRSESMSDRSETGRCNHLWRPDYVTVPKMASGKPVWKCECCGAETPR